MASVYTFMQPHSSKYFHNYTSRENTILYYTSHSMKPCLFAFIVFTRLFHHHCNAVIFSADISKPTVKKSSNFLTPARRSTYHPLINMTNLLVTNDRRKTLQKLLALFRRKYGSHDQITTRPLRLRPSRNKTVK